MNERETDRHRSGHAGRDVADRHRYGGRCTVSLANTVGDTGVGLADIVIAGLVGERPGLPGHRDRQHDDAWVDLFDLLIRKPKAVDYFRSEVFDDDIDFGQHRHHELFRARLFQVDGEAKLTVIVLHVIGTVRRILMLRTLRAQATGAYPITLWGEFELDYLGAHLGQ